MQSQRIDCQKSITLYLDEKFAFNRHLLSLLKQWDKGQNIAVLSKSSIEPVILAPATNKASKRQKHFYNDALQVVDKNGSSFMGAEAVPIILKHLPFGKLAAAIYILPGTMWVTKQLYALPFTH